MYNKLAAPQTVGSTSSGRLVANVGRQNYTTLVSMHNATKLRDIKTTIQGGADPRSIQLFLKSARTRLTLRNQANHNVRMTIYDIGVKKRYGSSSLDTPTEAWNVGVDDYGDADYDPTTVGVTPFKSPEFRRGYFVQNTTTLSMEPGQTHEHTVWHKYNRLLNSVIFEHGNDLAVAGVTRYCMVVFHGSLFHESATPITVTTGECVVDYMLYEEYSYSYLDSINPSVTFTNGLATALVDGDQMGEDQDQDLNAVNA